MNRVFIPLPDSRGLLRRSASSPSLVNAIPPIVRELMHTPDQPLDTDTRAFMESCYRHDYNHVRVQPDTPRAARANLGGL